MSTFSRFLPNGSAIFQIASSIIAILGVAGIGHAHSVTHSLTALSRWLGLPTEWVAIAEQWSMDQNHVVLVVGSVTFLLGLFAVAGQGFYEVLGARSTSTLALGLGLLLQAGQPVWQLLAVLLAVMILKGFSTSWSDIYIVPIAAVVGVAIAPAIVASWLLGPGDSVEVQKVRIVSGELKATVSPPDERPRGATIVPRQE